MDTQRLILFAIFSVSALFLWERWQAEQHPVQPPGARRRKGRPRRRARRPLPARRQRRRRRLSGGAALPAGEKIEIRTDRYVAQVDTRGGVITLLALTDHRDAEDAAKPYRLLQQSENSQFRRAGGAVREGHAQSAAESHDALAAVTGPS